MTVHLHIFACIFWIFLYTPKAFTGKYQVHAQGPIDRPMAADVDMPRARYWRSNIDTAASALKFVFF